MNSRRKFTRTIEDFTCERCKAEVVGNGYTNHCPQCLWSKHVDVSPGDRAHLCGGMMRPIALEGTSPNYTIVHECTVCGAQRRIGATKGDSASALVALASAGARGTIAT